MRIAKRLARPVTNVVGRTLLRVPPFRRAANRWYETRGPGFVSTFARLFSGARPRNRFEWTYRVLDRTLVIPVAPEFPRSWNTALSGRAIEPSVKAFYEAYLRRRPAGTMFDVGANYGLHSYPFLLHGYDVTMFEPQGECVRYIRAVSERNKLEPRVEQGVASDAPGELTFYTSTSTYFSSTSREAVIAMGEEPHEVRVPAQTLDAYAARTGLRPAVLKIDAEGHEVAVVRGAAEALRRDKPTVVVEIWTYAPENRRAIFEALEPLGYACFGLDPYHAARLATVEALVAFQHADFVFTADPEVVGILEGMKAGTP